MPSKKSWANEFVECFSEQPEGCAIYQPIKSSAMKPGMCGYFDVDGIWQTIVDLTNPDHVKAKNLPPVDGVAFSGPNLATTRNWGLRTSRDIKKEDISTDVKA
ncbi:hypothetical protein LTR22_025710, partial [Elasticomyces elasticus]